MDYPTLSRFSDYAKFISSKTSIVLSDSYSETPNDPLLVDLAFSFNNAFLNMASTIKLEKMLKFNRLIEIC